MISLRTLLAGFGLLWLSLGSAAHAQTPNNDGFQRRNGQMHVLRNGQLRPMTRDAHLPTGTVVTKDGFVVTAAGRRTELREGQGCDLRGNLVSVKSAPDGRLALGTPRGAARPARRPTEGRLEEVIEAFLGGRRRGDDDDKDEREDDKQANEYAREQRKKEAEWRREAEKRREEYYKERGKKAKKWKEGKGRDD